MARKRVVRHCSVCGRTGHDARRHHNPDFFTDKEKRVHPIRRSADYSRKTAGEMAAKSKTKWTAPRFRAVTRNDLLAKARQYASPEEFIWEIQRGLGVWDSQGKSIPMGKGVPTPRGRALYEAIGREAPGRGWFDTATTIWKEANPGRKPISYEEARRRFLARRTLPVGLRYKRFGAKKNPRKETLMARKRRTRRLPARNKKGQFKKGK